MEAKENKIKKIFTNIGRFFISKIFLINLGIILGILAILLSGTIIWLRIYTNHGETIEVPDFKGLLISEVTDIAKRNNVKYEIIDSVYSAPGLRGAVVNQTPPANFKVKKNRTIFLTIKTHLPEKVKMPKIIGVSIIQAKAELANYGLKIGEISYKPDIAKDNVLSQMIDNKFVEPGTLVEKGTKIDLVLGTGINED